MKKQISFTGKGQQADIGEMSINRILPNRYADAVGPFVFLDHIIPKIHTSLNKKEVKVKIQGKRRDKFSFTYLRFAKFSLI